MKNILIIVILITLASFIPADNVHTRFKPTAGYNRVAVAPGSFGAYLQALLLKPAGSHTKTYTGSIARTDPYTAAVIDMSIGSQDLQQCADAVMRLRAEYLYQQKNYKAITFNFTSGFKCDFVHYANGYRYADGRWVLKGKKDYSYNNFIRYMTLVFSYAGTLSLEKELMPVASGNDVRIADVFIKGGSPGHCFIVLDVAENAGHKKQFILVQSFIPAQNIQVLKSGSAWFSLDEPANIPYGELVNARYLKRF